MAANRRKKKWTHKVKSLEGSVDLIVYAAKVFPILGSKTAVRKAMDGSRLKLNGKPAKVGDRVKQGAFLELIGSGVRAVKKLDVELRKIYEDDHLIVIHKPSGIAVNGNRNKTVENALANLNRTNTLPDALPRPIAAHRIDVPTSGLVILAKSKGALMELGKAFQQNRVSKEYVAVVHGAIADSGEINDPIEGKPALTHYQKIEEVPSRVFGAFSLVKLQPITGRTHQLRIHLKDLGHLIVGDKQYAAAQKTILGKGLYLAACAVHLQHPITQAQLQLTIPTPSKFLKLLKREASRFQS